jgi:Fe-S cluster assembly protein SufD
VASGGGRGGEIVSSVAVITDPYTAAFAAREPDALQELRAAAMERFVSLGFPTIKNEEWRFTNLAPFLKEPYAPAPQPSFELVERQGGAGIVFMDGWFMPELSVAPAGIELRSLLDGPGAGLVGRGAAFEKNALVALNTAMFAGGVYIRIPDGTVLDEPISILHAATAARRQASFPRVLVVAGRDVQARVIEYFASTGEQFTCAVTEISAAEGAHIEHYKIQMESGQALHFGHLATRQGRSSTVASFNIAFGAALARNEIAAALDGEGAECTLNGLYVAGGRQHVDNYSTLEHIAPHTASRELYKGVLDGASRAVFHGRIVVRPEAQKTDAIQRNRNLLLSKEAVVNTKPQLEIYADDVRCTHGATVGQVDEDAVFYLRSRGIPRAGARALLTFAFAGEITDQIGIESVRERLADELRRRLGSDEAA